MDSLRTHKKCNDTYERSDDDSESTSLKREHYIYIYSGAMLLILYLALHKALTFFQICLRASINLHDKLFRGITRATMDFFNKNPSGRILNRFSKDIGCVDIILPVALMDCILVSGGDPGGTIFFITSSHSLPPQFFLELIAILTLVAVVNYWLLIPTFIMSLLFYGLRHIYVHTARSIKRIEAMSKYLYTLIYMTMK